MKNKLILSFALLATSFQAFGMNKLIKEDIKYGAIIKTFIKHPSHSKGVGCQFDEQGFSEDGKFFKMTYHGEKNCVFDMVLDMNGVQRSDQKFIEVYGSIVDSSIPEHKIIWIESEFEQVPFLDKTMDFVHTLKSQKLYVLKDDIDHEKHFVNKTDISQKLRLLKEITYPELKPESGIYFFGIINPDKVQVSLSVMRGNLLLGCKIKFPKLGETGEQWIANSNFNFNVYCLADDKLELLREIGEMPISRTGAYWNKQNNAIVSFDMQGITILKIGNATPFNTVPKAQNSFTDVIITCQK